MKTFLLTVNQRNEKTPIIKFTVRWNGFRGKKKGERGEKKGERRKKKEERRKEKEDTRKKRLQRLLST